MNKTLRILILEEHLVRQAGTGSIAAELSRVQLRFEARYVENKIEFLAALKEFSPDVIVSDYTLRGFNALEALRLLKKNAPDIPFIVYTDSLTEEIAVKCFREGVADYLVKSDAGNDDKQLALAVINAIEKSELRHLCENRNVALGENEYKLQNLLERMSEALLQVNEAEIIEFVNERFCRMTGYRREELLGKGTFDILFDAEGFRAISEADREQRAAANGNGGRAVSSQCELRLKKKNGETLWTIASGTPVINAQGAIVGTMRIFTDITERKLNEAQLMHDALHDALTGLANRTLFMHHLRKTIERGKRNPQNLYAVLFLDFDRFKVINDSLGHAEGDKLLKYIARRLEACTRSGDLVSRLGGDEFVILLDELQETGEALYVAERILTDLKYSFDLGGSEVFISTSIGITLSISGYERAEDMLRDADIAMYRAKAKGKAQYQVFDQAMRSEAAMQLQFETEMRQALDRGEFCLHYQPIFNLETKELIGFESLVRWNHPNRGIIKPMIFIPTAEENRLILPLGKWILLESCRQMRKWQTENPLAEALSISVNLSCKQFLQLDLAEQVAQALRETKLKPKCLKLEITESHVMENTEVAVGTLNRLRALGVQISLDDFGTGYSSLSYLHRLPIDYLKIDRSFISQMSESKENAEIVYTIIKLAQSLKMKVIAEGIETDEQLARLQLLNCEYGQGYLFSRPLEAEKTEIFISEALRENSFAANQPTINLEMNM